MRYMFRLFALFLLSVAVPASAYAQGSPADVDNPAPDVGDPDGREDIPDRLADIVLPQIQFLFDTVLDPNRLTLIEMVGESHADDPELTAAARSIIRNHYIAMQQVELAIRFLQANRVDILAGNNASFNRVFGNIGVERDVAIVNPNPLSGMATVGNNAMTGLIQLDFQTGGANAAPPNLPGQIQAGEFVFIGDAINLDPDGFVAEVKQILFDPDGDNQMLLVQPLGASLLALTGMQPVFKVIRFDKRADPARFDRVVQTFEAIRDGLQGLNPNLPPLLQTTSPITYNRGFTDINTIWAPGVAPFTSLDAIVARETSTGNLASTYTADRLFRQAGLSNSDSHLHIDRLDDQGNNLTTDYQGRATLPLLWTEDNELPLNLFNNAAVSGATDEDRAFFRDQQTIFGLPDDPTTQYIGRAFLEETLFHTGGFFEDQISVEPGSLDSSLVPERSPQRGPLVTRGPFNIVLPEQVTDPESGEATTEQTELRKWQMIIASFAEHSTDLSQLNVAAIGLSGIFNGLLPDDLRARDANSFARFANLIGGSSSGLGAVNFNLVEPFGKRATAGFFPVVPRN